MKTLSRTIFLSPLLLVSLFYLYNSFSKPQPSKEQIIEEIMNYHMPDVIKRCKKDFNYTDDDMKIIEKEFKRFLVLSVVTKDHQTGVGMYSKDVDNLWHSFILFTNEYADFSNKFNGKFIHHVPETEEVRSSEKVIEMRKDFQAFIKNYESIFKEEVHPVWFLDMCEEKA